MRNKYLLGYPIEGSLNSHLLSPEFTHRNFQITLSFPRGKKHPGEILGFIEVIAATHKEAHSIATEVMSDFIDVLSFVMKSSLFLMPPSVILKNELGSSKRVVYRQTSEDNISGLYLSEETQSATQELLKTLETQSDLPLRWLRFGYRARTFPEQFTYYWLGLERAVGETQIERKCPKCSHTLPSYPSIEKPRVKLFCQQHDASIDDSYFEKIWRCRQKVFHGARIDIPFLKELVEVTPKIEKILESFLNAKYQPKYRISLERPVPKIQRQNVNGFYEFQTKHLKEPYAMDYPTDNQLQEFNEGSDVTSKYGFELLTFEDYDRNW